VSQGSAPDPAVGVYSAPQDSLAGLRGLLLRGGKGTGGGKEGDGRAREREGRGGEGEEKGGDGKVRGSLGEKGRDPLHAPLIHISGYAPERSAIGHRRVPIRK